VAHSRSPSIHNYWLNQYNLPGAYVLLPVAPIDLEKALRALPLLGFSGCNLTIPHKEMALPWMDSIDAVTKKIGAVNTVVVESDGSLRGLNTDAFGFIEGLRTTQPNWTAEAGPCAIIGAGGASRAVIVALLDAGVSEIRLINRTYSRAVELAHEFGSVIQPILWDDRSEALAHCSLLVNASSLGMQGQPPLDIFLHDLPKSALVYDIIFAPWETKLLASARDRGHEVVNGIPMLIEQARLGFSAWFGVMPDNSDALFQKLKLIS
jgi:shikimate dehydrogenase